MDIYWAVKQGGRCLPLSPTLRGIMVLVFNYTEIEISLFMSVLSLQLLGSEQNLLITYKLANQHVQTAMFTCVVYTSL